MKNFMSSSKINFVMNIILLIVIIFVSYYCYILHKKVNLIIQDQKEYNKIYIPNASSTAYNYNWPIMPTLPTSVPLPGDFMGLVSAPAIHYSNYPTSSPEFKLEMEERNRQSEILNKKFIENQKKLEDLRELTVGCFYGEELRMGRLQINRNAYFNKYTPTLASSTQYTGLDGSYDASKLLELSEITLIPNTESKFKMKLVTKDKEINLVDENKNYYTKGTCTDFYPYNH